MKWVFPILLLLLITGLVISVASQDSSTTEISIVRDITDPHQAQPSAKEILGLYDLEINKWNGAIFHFSNLSDVSYNPSSEVKLQAKNKWLSNELERADEIQEFQNKVNTVLSDSLHDTIGKKYSSIYFPVANELMRLQKSISQRKILLVFSDLMQNDFEISLYGKKEFELLESHPDSLKVKFEKELPLPSLAGITIFLMYQPTNAEEDWRYRIISEFYKNLFTKKGAEVTISANLPN